MASALSYLANLFGAGAARPAPALGVSPDGRMIDPYAGYGADGSPPAQTGPMGLPLRADPTPSDAVSSSQPGLPPMPTWAPRNKVGDLLDSLFLGGAIRHNSESDYAHQLDNWSRARSAQVLAGLPMQEQKAAIFNGPEYGKAIAANFAPHAVAEGATERYGDGSSFTAPKTVVDNGRINVVTPDGAREVATTGPSFNADGLDTRGLAPQAGFNKPVPLDSQNYSTGGTYQPGQGARVAASLPQIGGAPAPAAPSGVASAMPQRPVADMITGAARQAGLGPADAANLVTIGKLESSLRPDAPNNGSSTGLFQMHPATFQALGGKNINDPQEQAAMSAKLYAQNKQSLTGTLGREPDATELYLAHQQGLPAATALLSAEPGRNAIDALISAGVYPSARMARLAITGNGGGQRTTVGQFIQGWRSRVAQAQGGVDGSAPAPTGGPAPAAPPPAAATGQASFSGAPRRFSPAAWNSQTNRWEQTNLLTGKVEEAGQGAFNPQELRKSVMEAPDYKEARAAMTAFKAMIGNASTLTGPAAYSMLDTFARAINPGAVARPQVIETIEQNLGLPAQVQGSLMTKFGQGNLPEGVRQQILDAVSKFAQAHWDGANAQIQSARNVASRAGLNPDDVAPPLEEKPAPVHGELPAKAQLQPGHIYPTARGPAVWTGQGFRPYG